MTMAPKSANTFPPSSCCKKGCQENVAYLLKFVGTIKYDYDLIVIGGGSGGLSAAKEASKLGAKVAVLDYVTPTPLGTKWGLGGTCINVGCIPKKLMHHASILGEALNDSKYYGWQVRENIRLDWTDLINAIQDHIRSVNWTTRVELAERKIELIHGIGSFKDPHTIFTVTHPHDEELLLTAKYILIAVGARPRYLKIPGSQEYGITSDDLFSLDKPPGKTLIIGGGYIALECAGFLHGFGYDVTVMNRTLVVLRRFDQQMANLVIDEMKSRGVKFLLGCKATNVSKSVSSERLIISWKSDACNAQFTDNFDTIMFAIGRKALTKELNLENAGVKVARDGETIDTTNEQTNVPHIYAVGDVLYGKPQLTPIAIQAGTLLSRRLFGGSKVNMDYELFASTVFTPLEYGTVGLSEEAAIKRYGEDCIEVYHTYYTPAEFYLPERSPKHCYLKVIAMREGAQKVLGMHFTGLNAGEIIQGFAIGMKCGLTVDDLQNTVSLHTTNAEEFTKLSITKRSGKDPIPAACCN